jgi:hypothetical protein
LVDALAEHRGFIATAQHVLQRECSLQDGLRVAGKQIEKPFLLGKKGAKKAQHMI